MLMAMLGQGGPFSDKRQPSLPGGNGDSPGESAVKSVATAVLTGDQVAIGLLGGDLASRNEQITVLKEALNEFQEREVRLIKRFEGLSRDMDKLQEMFLQAQSSKGRLATENRSQRAIIADLQKDVGEVRTRNQRLEAIVAKAAKAALILSAINSKSLKSACLAAIRDALEALNAEAGSEETDEAKASTDETGSKRQTRVEEV